MIPRFLYFHIYMINTMHREKFIMKGDIHHG